MKPKLLKIRAVEPETGTVLGELPTQRFDLEKLSLLIVHSESQRHLAGLAQIQRNMRSKGENVHLIQAPLGARVEVLQIDEDEQASAEKPTDSARS
ncbi:MAG: hypothetical protein R3212_04225 [Xanthomonadales bacterium]|nr:hypothetical protein [Xanthomonadales bacterium]